MAKTMADKADAKLYRHMLSVAQANGFESLTDAITRAVKAEAESRDPPATDVTVEANAQVVFSAMIWAVNNAPQAPTYLTWLPGGNSQAQDEARRVARIITATLPHPGEKS